MPTRSIPPNDPKRKNRSDPKNTAKAGSVRSARRHSAGLVNGMRHRLLTPPITLEGLLSENQDDRPHV